MHTEAEVPTIAPSISGTRYKKLIGGPPITPAFKMPGEYISSGVAAKMLGITKPTIIKEALEGNINAHVRRGRYLFTQEDIQEYVQNNMTCRKHAYRALKL